MTVILKRSLIVLAAVAAGLQLVPVARTNPEVTDDIKAPEPVAALLRRACYDCHSHETRWPWYAYVAPVSWSVASHVREGREALNFSLWSQGEQEFDELIDRVKEASMPPPGYLTRHPEARLSRDEVRLLEQWVEGGAPVGEGAQMP